MAAEQLPIAARLGATARPAETTQSPTSTKGVTNMERALGALINIMNPYSNPRCEPFDAGRSMQFAAGAPGQGIAGDDAGRLAQIAVEIDNYQGGEDLHGADVQDQTGFADPLSVSPAGGRGTQCAD